MNSVYERDLRLLQSKYDQLEAAYQALAESGRKLNQHINELQTDNAELRIENESLRKDAELHKQIQRACGDLPEGWEIRLSLENGAGWFDLFDDNGNHVEFASNHENLAETLSDAIDAAMGEGK